MHSLKWQDLSGHCVTHKKLYAVSKCLITQWNVQGPEKTKTHEALKWNVTISPLPGVIYSETCAGTKMNIGDLQTVVHFKHDKTANHEKKEIYSWLTSSLEEMLEQITGAWKTLSLSNAQQPTTFSTHISCRVGKSREQSSKGDEGMILQVSSRKSLRGIKERSYYLAC